MADQEIITHQTNNQHQIQLSKLLDLSLDVICTIDAKGKFVTVSAAALSIWGYKPDELVGQHVFNFIHPDDQLASRLEGQKIKAGHSVTNLENRFICKNGSLAPMAWSARRDDEQKMIYCIARDGSERLKAAQQLQLNEQRFKSLVQHSSDMISILSMDANYIYKSASSYAITGWHPEKFIGRNAFYFIHPADHEMVLTAFKQLTNLKTVHIPPFRFKHQDSGYRWLETVLTNRLSDPTIGGIVANSRDVTERIKALDKLKESEAKLKLAAEIARLGYWQHLADGTNRYWSDEVFNIMGISKKADLNDVVSLLTVIHPDDKERYFKKQAQYLSGEEHSIEYRVIDTDGTIKWVCETGRKVKDDKTDEYIVIGTLQDITAQKLLAISFEESTKRYKYATKASSDAIWDWNLEQNLHYLGEGFETTFGHLINEDDLSINTWINNIHPEDSKRVSDGIYNVINSTENTWVDEYRFLRANGTYAYVVDKGFVIRDERGKALRMVGAMHDISGQKKAEKELKAFADDLYKRNKELHEFGYIVSHNLRSPVANIMGIADLLDMDKEDADTVEMCADNLKKAVKSLDMVIKDLSTILSATDGSLMVHHESINLQEVISNIKTDLKDAIIRSDAVITELDQPFILFSHKAYVYSIFYNLISNAIKYRSSKQPIIHITVTAGYKAVSICVRDNGIGLDLAKHGSDLFKPYKRFNTHTQGKGLGLFLVKSHIEALDGTLSVESEVGVGTAFTIELPIDD
ncbi:PAS domain-containing sensor histidine kinase [Mucilaginibacter lacusdianchii]|uniref:PAS domain-containing sensor histidine kinase n=1 Tax=Mucilaginibacter lacusdianchii TaxID=2684211 RepID=UPI00131CCF19|nr:PAS domain-containing sensor histidine kinase [Mucilaginibacter sp. JXJ CY 39]